jgi:hypothetical protein
MVNWRWPLTISISRNKNGKPGMPADAAAITSDKKFRSETLADAEETGAANKAD